MKINESGRIGSINSYQRQLDNQRQLTDKKAKRKDEVYISATAQELLQAQSQEKAQDPARVQRIQDLKAQVSSGTYEVEAGKLADKLAPYFKTYSDNN
ncbi:negative regulator of flagellin synthesis FlgM [Paenibacillus shirakamiensis]|uniref:Negative regulator of flagellin synthesis n=1 Tax=Paenibacillus shirakamiensis TaxID=1265935 RepID=A0ABS4JL23_9BACL|nr:flagellar biosynthesis anti-sigma factor FlgM [Paenibacillus shirakamiensis]MBP2001781.1 negative regulator of flagellin synthesis FlgM [Paenibacillus shirakamiensis]